MWKSRPISPSRSTILLRLLESIAARGFDYSDFKGTPGAVNVRPDGVRAVFLQDPNGYWIELNDSPFP